jgi:hypothetical protein
MVKLRKMRLAWHLARIGKKRNVYRFGLEGHKKKYHYEDIDVCEDLREIG